MSGDARPGYVIDDTNDSPHSTVVTPAALGGGRLGGTVEEDCQQVSTAGAAATGGDSTATQSRKSTRSAK